MGQSAGKQGAGNGHAAILVVDDSQTIRESLSSLLRGAGYRVGTAGDGHEAYEKARALSPDIILSDLEMPVANGLDLLAQVRGDAQLALVPFVMVTSVTDRPSIRRAMELGADDYLTKPFTPDEVLATVRSRLAKQGNWRQATQALARHYSQTMLGILPHEFRTPLNAILGFAEYMKMNQGEGLSADETREIGEMIQGAGQRLLDHTRRFLKLMEYQAAPATPSDAICLIERDWVAALCRKVLAEQVPPGDFQLRVEIAASMVLAREDYVRNLLRELLSNAAKFGRAGSVLAVSGGPAANGQRYVLSIDDEGRPFPLNRLQQVDAFTQFDRDQMEQQGLGIGLAIVSHALRLCGGELSIDNLPGNVVRVSLDLPLALDAL